MKYWVYAFLVYLLSIAIILIYLACTASKKHKEPL